MSFTLSAGGELGHLPALEVLGVDCYWVEPPIASSSLVQLEIAGFRAPPHSVC